MKKILFGAAIALLAATGCTTDSVETVVENNAEQATAPVTVRVSDFSISQEEMPSGSTRAAQSAASYNYVKAIDLAFYSGETEVYKTTQVRGDGTYTTFGEFSCNLPLGTYTMVVVGRDKSDGDVFTLTSPTEAAYTGNFARETFCATQSVTVTAAGADIGITLNRINSAIQIVSTDGRPAGATKVRTTYAAGSKSFDPTTGLATDDNGFSVINTPSSAVGDPINPGSYLFLATDEETMSITLQVLDNYDNVLVTKVVPNVPLKRNRLTILRGALFTAESSSAAFQLETSWIEDHTVNF